MAGENEVRGRILEAATEQFLRFGFTRVTMDEIASGLGMSKKTLYQHFPGKETLLQEVMRRKMREIEAGYEGILRDDGLDFVEKLKNLMSFMAVQFSRVGQVFLQDLQKNAPEVWREVETFRGRRASSLFGNLVSEGIQKGMFRADVDQHLLTLLYVSAIQGIINPDALSQLPLSASQAFENIIKIIYEGILTDKARARYVARQR